MPSNTVVPAVASAWAAEARVLAHLCWLAG